MEVRAQHRNARMAPRKIRAYRGILKGLPVAEALAQLQFMPGEASAILRHVLTSAVANAVHNFGMVAADLLVADVVIDGGFTLKRSQPVSRGSAHPILKRTSNVTMVVAPKATATGVKARRGRKTNIQDFTAADVVAGKVGSTREEEGQVTEQMGKGKGTSVAPSKQQEAYTKIKTQQLGGDPKKSHRRKSLGE